MSGTIVQIFFNNFNSQHYVAVLLRYILTDIAGTFLLSKESIEMRLQIAYVFNKYFASSSTLLPRI